MKVLEASGQVLMGLSAARERQLGSEFIWRFEQRVTTGAASRGEEGEGALEERGCLELPYHQLRRGDSLMLVETLADGVTAKTKQACSGGLSKAGNL